jgi:predicted DNA binding protein
MMISKIVADAPKSNNASEDDRILPKPPISTIENEKIPKPAIDLEIIYSTPMIISEEKHIYSCIGDHENLIKFLDFIKTMGTIKNMTFKRAVYQKHDILTILTEKQKEILITAHRYGYYDYPKKINSEELSEKVDISRATMVEHLRKAEGRIVNEILTGYS